MGNCNNIEEYNENPKKIILEDYIKNNMEGFNNNNNIIKMKLKIGKDDVNKPTKILYNIESQRKDCDLKELNESNTELFINEKKYDYKSYFTPEKEGLYEIQLNVKILMKNCCCLFYGLKNLQSLDLSSFKTQNVTNMSYMYCKCYNLQSLDLSSFNTQKVTDMKYMFYECNNLQNLNLSSFKTQNVTNMNCMFEECNKLQSLNLLSFNTQKVTNMDSMFYKCKDLQSLDLSSFNTQNVSDINYIFEGAGLKRVVVNVLDIKLISKATYYSIDILYS
jgi:surface protein